MASLSDATLYAGKVAHIRHAPFRHRFDYRIWMLAIDLDRVDDVAAASGMFSHNRFGLLALYDKDHGPRDGSPLRPWVEAALQRDGLAKAGARIIFLTMPRLLGYAFNPISFYFCYDAAGQLGAILHQVKSTFGDQIGYLMPVSGPGNVRQSTEKHMHVSPFFDMQGGYQFDLTAPAEAFTVSIRYGAAGVRRMTATMRLQARPWRPSAILRLLFEMPLTPMKVMLAIHWQALLLFCRGAVFHKIPAQPHSTIIAGDVE